MSRLCRHILTVMALAGLIGLSPALASTTPLSAGDVKAYSAAFSAAEAGNWKDAHRLAGKAQNRLPAKVLHWLDMRRHRTTRSFEDIAAFVEANPVWPGLHRLRRRAEEAMDAGTPDEAVLRWFAKHPPITTHGRIRLIDALMATGETDRAGRLARETWIDGNFGRAQEHGFRRRYRPYLSAADHVARLDRLLWEGNFVQARRTVRLVDKGVQRLAMARIALRAFRGGVDWHIRQVPAEIKNDPGLVYERVRWRRRKGRDDDAYALLKTVPPTAPYAEFWWNERAILARRLLAKGHISEAYRLAKANGLTEGVEFVEAEWLAGWIALRFLKEPREALAHFERIRAVVNYPISKARAAYWAGRAAADAGDDRAAARYFTEASRHDTTYYGQLAAARTGGPIDLRTAEVRPTGREIADFNGEERVQIVFMLNQIGADDHVRPFVDSLVDDTDSPVRQLLAARLANAIDRRDLAVRAGRKAYRAGAPLPSVAYPIMRVPAGHPEEALIHAIARQESNFDPGALSHAGARGLMQLMPRTALHVAKRLRIQYSRNRLLQDPEYNIRLGRAYLGQMLDRFDGSYILAVAAYNAGPANAARWVRENGDPRDGEVDVIDWIEMIPYSETRNYVQRVIENLQVYRARLGGPLLAQAIVDDLRR